MGTNYYLQGDTCEHCERGDESLHIGKSSAGWCFSLHVLPYLKINTLDDWKLLFEVSKITNEYGEEISTKKMLSVIENRSFKRDWSKKPMGYPSWSYFHEQNHSQRGPEGLLRHRIEDGHCIRHGEGTYDCIVSEFS